MQLQQQRSAPDECRPRGQCARAPRPGPRERLSYAFLKPCVRHERDPLIPPSPTPAIRPAHPYSNPARPLTPAAAHGCPHDFTYLSTTTTASSPIVFVRPQRPSNVCRCNTKLYRTNEQTYQCSRDLRTSHTHSLPPTSHGTLDRGLEARPKRGRGTVRHRPALPPAKEPDGRVPLAAQAVDRGHLRSVPPRALGEAPHL